MDTNSMPLLDTLTKTVVAGNELWRLLALFLAILLPLIGAKVGQYVLNKSADLFDARGRAATAVTLRAFAKSMVFVFFAIGARIGMAFLVMSESLQSMTDAALSVLMALAIGYMAYRLLDVVDHWLQSYASKDDGKLDKMIVPMVRVSLRVTIIILVLLQIAQSLTDKPLTSILAGLGVGGLALALAAQDTIKNFFGSLVLFADKPFVMGDRVVVDTEDGVVEEVGFRSTRIRTLDGHLVTIPNGELANKTIRNISRRPYIRRLTNITITYDTPPEKVDRALEILRELLENHEGMRPELPSRVIFNEFNSASLNILMIYWYHPPDFWKYNAFNEWLNLQILRRFNKEGISFAFPTQTVYVATDPARPFKPDFQALEKRGV